MVTEQISMEYFRNLRVFHAEGFLSVALTHCFALWCSQCRTMISFLWENVSFVFSAQLKNCAAALAIHRCSLSSVCSAHIQKESEPLWWLCFTPVTSGVVLSLQSWIDKLAPNFYKQQMDCLKNWVMNIALSTLIRCLNEKFFNHN